MARCGAGDDQAATRLGSKGPRLACQRSAIEEPAVRGLLASAGKLRLVGLKPHLRDIFTYSGFDQLFEIESAS